MIVSRIVRILSLLIVSSSRVFSTNVCPKTENYTITSMETYSEPVIVNTFTWCLRMPPMCLKKRTEMRQRSRVKTEVKTRIVNACCEGYERLSIQGDDDTDIRCVPSCENCLTGVCVSPNQCQCNPGYRGDDCASECPPGTWGFQCEQKCDCDQEISCNPINGYCTCPPGLHGRTCNETCPEKRFGPGCTYHCDCEYSSGECHPETGACIEVSTPLKDVPSTYPETSTAVENGEASSFTVTERGEVSRRVFETTERPVEETRGPSVSTNYPFGATSPETTAGSSSDYPQIRTRAQEDDASSTVRPVIVLVSVPERRRNLEKDRPKFGVKNAFATRVDEGVQAPPPKTDYTKTVRKEDVQGTPIPLEIALIVVASIVSLGVTSVAVVMVLHMRSKLFETVRLSINSDEKTKSQERESATTGRISTIMASALPQTPVLLSPTTVFTAGPESATILTVGGIEPPNNYANGAATIGLRISGNLRDLLQDGHYDRPPATLIRLHTDYDANTEHVYDEIPLQSTPLCSRKNA